MEHLLAQLRTLNISLSLDGDRLGIEAPQGALTPEVIQMLTRHKQELIALLQASDLPGNAPALTVEPSRSSEPFPLTDLQHAYWLGRDPSLEMGHVAAHQYMELDCERLDVPRLNVALNAMIARHDMLRTTVQGGMQQVLPEVAPYQIEVTDVSTLAQEEAEHRLLAVRERLSHQVRNPEIWPLCDVHVTHLPGGRSRLHCSADMLIFDLNSLMLFFHEWHQQYLHPENVLPPLQVSFRDAVLADLAVQETPQHAAAVKYWMDRVDHLPGPPSLPIKSEVQRPERPRFSRREIRLTAEEWSSIKTHAQSCGLTPSMVCLAVYALVLGRWSGSCHFTLNATHSTRKSWHSDLEQVIGNFTSLMLLEVDCRNPQQGFRSFALALQEQMLEDLQHLEFCGVSVIREWAKRHGNALQATMPISFTSGLRASGQLDGGALESFGHRVYSSGQTSQTWLEQLVIEAQGDLISVWDAPEALYEGGVIGNMVEAYTAALRQLARAEMWDSSQLVALPMQMLESRPQTTFAELPDSPLHAGLVTQARQHPDRMAVFSASRHLTYSQLLSESAALAHWLLEREVRLGEPVAVLMNKGWEQVVAVYGILLAGGAYVPINATLPLKRQQELLELTGVRFILTQPGTLDPELQTRWDTLDVQAGKEAELTDRMLDSLRTPLDQLAYIVFTSGTTGIPKGVMIDHLGAKNTVMHINRLCRVGPEDRVLAVSSLSFDLSVYDIFGLFEAGGAVVLPDPRKGADPAHWQSLMEDHQVTLWNSAPQLMHMLTEHTRNTSTRVPLRNVLLSGDFIPLCLPDSIREHHPAANIWGLGGATEASIWSIFYPIGQVDPAWKSIPYGKALPNQTMQVLDDALSPCPDFVKGRIFIGGVGLAKGYWKDPEKTAERFIVHPYTGERLYNTGDLGHQTPDGNIVILGREDRQVKIRGYRVEPAEIEHALRQHPAVRQAVVLPTGEHPSLQLVAFIDTDPKATDLQDLRTHLKKTLPDHLVPHHLLLLEALPLSSNGKVDHKKLLTLATHLQEQPSTALPRNPLEQKILEVWQEVLMQHHLGIADNFFDVGGDSVLAMQLVRQLNTVLPGLELEVHELFMHSTIETLAELYQDRQEHQFDLTPTRKALVSDEEQQQMLEDLNTLLQDVSSMDFPAGLSATPACPERIFLTGATGWVGGHLLAELLSQTEAQVCCLVRPLGGQDPRKRLLDHLKSLKLDLPENLLDRVEVLSGDLSKPRLGLEHDVWDELCTSVDSIYHLGASLNLVASPTYSAHRTTNVLSALEVIRLASMGRPKAVHLLTPMTTLRRYVDGAFTVFSQEKRYGPEGLTTGYAQAKWAAETIFLSAAEQGMSLRAYRTSHALPSAKTGQVKPTDTYLNVLRVAGQVGMVPDWEGSQMGGIPVDVLARLLVEHALHSTSKEVILHLENQHPLSIKTIAEVLTEDRSHTPMVPLDTWLHACQSAAAGLGDAGGVLAEVLFSQSAEMTAVERMFYRHPVDTTHLNQQGYTERLSHLTPVEYWQKLRRVIRGALP